MNLKKKVRVQAWASLGVCIFSVLVIIGGAFFIEGYTWQFMLLPILLNAPLAAKGFSLTGGFLNKQRNR